MPATGPSRTVIATGATGAVGLIWAGLATAAAYRATTLSRTTFVVAVLVGVSFLAAGLLARHHQPANRVGALMVACGASWYLPCLQASLNPVLFGLGYWLYFLPWLLFVHLVLVFPYGRLHHRLDRLTLGFGYVAYLVLQGIRYLRESDAGPIG